MKFVVLTTSRTGSTWLIDLLNMSKGVQAHGELFLNQPRLKPAIAGRADYRRFAEIHGSPGMKRIYCVCRYLNSLYRIPGTIGFKLMYGQLRQLPEIFAYLAFRKIRIVHLTRRNLIDVIISEELARQTGMSHVQAGTKTSLPIVRLDANTLRGRVRRLDRKRRNMRIMLRLSACPMLEVSYERLLEGSQEFDQILEFLDVKAPDIQFQSSLEKRGIRTHREAIANYDEVRRALESSPYLDMLR